jgi:hypothetical protein
MPPGPPGAGAPPYRHPPTPQGLQPPPSPKTNRRWLWLAIAVVAVIAVVVGLVVWRASDRSDGRGSSNAPTEGQVPLGGPVGLIAEKDPICDRWVQDAQALADAEDAWGELDKSIPASKWTSEQAKTYADVGDAMRNSASRFESILPLGKYPVIQELVAQTIVYLRDFSDKIPTYVAADGLISGVAGNFGSVVTSLCAAVPALAGADLNDITSATSTAPDPDILTRFLNGGNAPCGDYVALIERQRLLLSGWRNTDPTIPSSQWSGEVRTVNLTAQAVLSSDARKIEKLGQNPPIPLREI